MIHFINENSELKHRIFPLSTNIKKYLLKLQNSYNGDKTVDGYKRLNNLLEMDGISYSEMKRLKNFFDNYKGDKKSIEYVLNGGDNMALWVNNTLKNATQAVHDFKQAKKDAGVKNAFIKTHEKNRQTKTKKPTQVHIKSDSRSLYNNDNLKYESKTFVVDCDMLMEMDVNNNCFKSFEEVISHDENFTNSDFPKRKAVFCNQSKKVKVFATEPIRDNNIVFTSKMEALSHSKDGRIYSKEVNTNNIQWLTNNIGKYIQII